MKYGIVKVAACTPTVTLNNPAHNAGELIAGMKKLAAEGAEIVVFPELCLCGYTAMDLLFTRELPAINVTLEYFASAGATGETVDATTVTENFNDWFESVFNAGNFNAGFYKLTFTVDGTDICFPISE